VVSLGFAVVGIALFVVAIRSMLATIRIGQPTVGRSDHPGARWVTMLRETLGHTRMLQWTAVGSGTGSCSSYPIAGGAYNIVSRLLGRLPGWQVGWWLEIAHVVSLAGSCVAIAPLLASYVGWDNLGHWSIVGVTGALILISTLINIGSVKLSARFVDAGVWATLVACVLVSVVLIGALIFGGHDVHGFDYLFTTEGTVKGSIVLPLLYAALLPGIVLNGFDVSGNASEEVKDARRAVPRGMVIANTGSYIFGTIVILLFLLGMTNTHDTLAATQPVTYILDPILGSPIAKTFEILAVLGLYVSGVVLQMAGARVIWAQARDGEFPLPHIFGKLNKDQVPAAGVWFGGIVAFLLVLWSSLYAVLIAMTVVLWVAGYGVLITGLYLGKLKGVVPAPAFGVKGWKILFPLAIAWSALVAFVLIYQNPRQVGIGLLIVAVAGLAVYFVGLPKKGEADRILAEHGGHHTDQA
jgi:amino acid transporter